MGRSYYSHQQRLVEYPLSDRTPIMVDDGMVKPLATAWAAGIATYYSCQGDPNFYFPRGYIAFDITKIDEMLDLNLFPSWVLDPPMHQFDSMAVLRWHALEDGTKQTECAVFDCPRKPYARCMCNTHYKQYKTMKGLQWA
jgi:hypothetical protein